MTGTAQRRRHVAHAAAIVGALGLLLGACSTDGDSSAAGDAGASDTPTALNAEAVAASAPTLDAIVERIMGASGVPGVAVGVVHDGKVVITKGYGVREVGTDAAVDAETVFQVASLSKPIGSTAVAGVVGRGDMAWDQPVITELPRLKLSDPYVTENVTLADFYSHRSGLPGDTAGNDLERFGYSQDEIIERLQYLPLAPFRATYSYSNFGLTIGGLAAAEAYGAPFATMAEEVLFEPAGMTSTSYRYDDFAERDNAAKLHVRVGDNFEARFTRNADAQAPAGGVSSNVVDLARWMLLTLNDGELDGEQIIDADALAETKRPYIRLEARSDPLAFAGEYGLGWNIGPSAVDPGPLEWGHSGAFTVGAGTTVNLLPTLGLGVVVLTNGQPLGVAEAIAGEYIDTLVNGEATLDWCTDGWGPVFAELFAPTEPGAPASPAPARPASGYVGTYANDYFGDIVVREGVDGLELAWGPDGAEALPLEPLDGDTFLIDSTPELPGSRSPVTFAFANGSGEATSITVTLGPTTMPWMTLGRVSP